MPTAGLCIASAYSWLRISLSLSLLSFSLSLLLIRSQYVTGRPGAIRNVSGAGSRCGRASHLGVLLAGREVHGNDAAGDGVRRPRHGRVAPTEVVWRNVRQLGNTQVAAAATVAAPRIARRLQQQACRAEVHVRGCVVALGARVILQTRSVVSDIVVSVGSDIASDIVSDKVTLRHGARWDTE